jgi:hypothetical protein
MKCLASTSVSAFVPRDQDLTKAAPNYSPNFFIDEKALARGRRAGSCNS